MRLGVIAEDDTDCDVISVLVGRIASGAGLGVSRRRGEGCGQIPRKAAGWARDLVAAGCSAIVIVHDLDRDPQSRALHVEAELRSKLEAIECPQGTPRLICIPIEEIEAWFWSDPVTVRKVGHGRGDALEHPHTKARPKEALEKLSRDAGGKPRYSTNDNKRLAQLLDLDLCAQRCKAFRELRDFVRGLLAA